MSGRASKRVLCESVGAFLPIFTCLLDTFLVTVASVCAWQSLCITDFVCVCVCTSFGKRILFVAQGIGNRADHLMKVMGP